MTGIALLITCIVITWLAAWASNEKPNEPGVFNPFIWRDESNNAATPKVDPTWWQRRHGPKGLAPKPLPMRSRSRPVPPAAHPRKPPPPRAPHERPWKRSGF